jgi:hypothetical protein
MAEPMNTDQLRAFLAAADRLATTAVEHRGEFIGMNLAESETFAAELGLTMRSIDLSSREVTLTTDDLRRGRITLYLRDGLVVDPEPDPG